MRVNEEKQVYAVCWKQSICNTRSNLVPAHAQSQTHKTTELYKCWENNRIRVQIRVKAFWYAKKNDYPIKYLCISISALCVCVCKCISVKERAHFPSTE